MRFSEGGLYVEAYIKCANCGVLIYEADEGQLTVDGTPFCSQWCHDWHKARDAGTAE